MFYKGISWGGYPLASWTSLALWFFLSCVLLQQERQREKIKSGYGA